MATINNGKYICEGCAIKIMRTMGYTDILFKPVVQYGHEWYFIDTNVSLHKEVFPEESLTRKESEKKVEEILSSVKLINTPSGDKMVLIGDMPLFSYGWGDRSLLPEYLTMYSYGNHVKGCWYINTDELEQADPYMHIYRHPYKNGEKKGGMKCKVSTIDGGF